MFDDETLIFVRRVVRIITVVIMVFKEVHFGDDLGHYNTAAGSSAVRGFLRFFVGFVIEAAFVSICVRCLKYFFFLVTRG